MRWILQGDSNKCIAWKKDIAEGRTCLSLWSVTCFARIDRSSPGGMPARRSAARCHRGGQTSRCAGI
ncbi:hypothetical protein [Bradyrhizobium sp. STM 3557]|uniref:hypothetical protein n=1 Tax=Bradyrhizobium sp. STM 3557 TaxID=578920 RepID=UPI003890428A